MDDGSLCFLEALLKRKLDAGFLKIKTQNKTKNSEELNKLFFSAHLPVSNSL